MTAYCWSSHCQWQKRFVSIRYSRKLWAIRTLISVLGKLCSIYTYSKDHVSTNLCMIYSFYGFHETYKRLLDSTWYVSTVQGLKFMCCKYKMLLLYNKSVCILFSWFDTVFVTTRYDLFYDLLISFHAFFF